MKHPDLPTAALALAFSLLWPVQSSALELDSFLGEINVSAHADLGSFRADLSATFGVSSHEVEGLFEVLDSPADVYITLRIGEVARVPIARVLTQYQANKSRGWGVIAKNLGIKPGSPEFHALKKGRLTVRAQRSSGKPGKGKGASRTTGHK